MIFCVLDLDGGRFKGGCAGTFLDSSAYSLVKVEPVKAGAFEIRLSGSIWKCKEWVMQKTLVGALLVTSMLVADCSRAKAVPVATDQGGAVVIVFKDGHRQSIPASSITAMEFKSAAGVVTSIAIPALVLPGRSVFFGKCWLGKATTPAIRSISLWRRMASPGSRSAKLMGPGSMSMARRR